MACGSVFASDPGLTAGRDLSSGADLHPDLAAATAAATTPVPRSSYRPTGEVHEAVRFLQAEHEAVLRGLHQQVTRLQQRCEELEFEAHLRPLTVDHDAWRRRVSEAARRAEENASRAAKLERQAAAAEEQLEQHRWREATLRQQVEAGEQRAADLRAEVTRLRAQVRDLRVYSTALRTGGGSARTPTPRGPSRALRPPSRSSLGSQESLEGGAGPRSLGSEDGEAGGWWREARLGGSAAVRGARGGTAHSLPRTPAASLPPSLPSPPPSLPPLASLPPARPSSGAVVLPPIQAGRGGASRHVRRQIRLASAPAPAATPSPGPRHDAVPQREPA
ncbi:uncharacterized protein LOC126981873 isoform X2 [Eriocheir sinensis]|nr:uncharacterized protein LOC126981873 isoform X2 [Eriocheir sinensis]XP_050689424.1 uncharacterized protein LOC126981873 isoform X2 [Eriocheir sinensis]XP_050689425.1 uncharacterized protein LOC126981873 isoform X2 [Eriocheir sinensis]